MGDDADLAELEADSTLVVGSWRFAGIGWLTAGDAALGGRVCCPGPGRLTQGATATLARWQAHASASPDCQPPVVVGAVVKGEAERIRRTRSALDDRTGDPIIRSREGRAPNQAGTCRTYRTVARWLMMMTELPELMTRREVAAAAAGVAGLPVSVGSFGDGAAVSVVVAHGPALSA